MSEVEIHQALLKSKKYATPLLIEAYIEAGT